MTCTDQLAAFQQFRDERIPWVVQRVAETLGCDRCDVSANIMPWDYDYCLRIDYLIYGVDIILKYSDLGIPVDQFDEMFLTSALDMLVGEIHSHGASSGH